MIGQVKERLRHLKGELDNIVATRLQWLADEKEPEAPEPSPEPTTAEAPTIEGRRRAAHTVIKEYAGLAAANALNPVPVLDLGMDVGLLLAMSHSVAAVYDLGPADVAPITHGATTSLGRQLLKKLRNQLTMTVTRRVLATTLPRLGMEVVARETCKWLPLAGTALAAHIGYDITRRLGAKLIEHCEAQFQVQCPTSLEAMPS